MLRYTDKNQVVIRLSLIRKIFATESVYLAPTNQIIFLEAFENLADLSQLNAQTVLVVICNEQCIKFVILQIYETLYLHFDTLLSENVVVIHDRGQCTLLPLIKDSYSIA